MRLTIETDQEVDGRWIAEVLEMPGVVVYGKTRDEAIASVEALALRVIADRIEHGEEPATGLSLTFTAAGVTGRRRVFGD